MPIWITESNDKFVIDLIGDLNTSEDSSASAVSSHPVSPFTTLVLRE
jgi:hypothetical protein